MSRPFFHSGTSIVDKAFPIPAFLRMGVSGLDISENFVRFIEFGGTVSNRFVKKFGERVIPKGAIVGGYIHRLEDVIRVLSDIRKETGITFVNVSLPEEKAYLFKVEMPKLGGQELRDAVGFRIEENVPVSAKDSIFDFAVLGNDKKKSEHVDVVVSVIPSKVSETYASVVKAAGFIPVSFEIISQAVSRAVAPKEEKDASYIV